MTRPVPAPGGAARHAVALAVFLAACADTAPVGPGPSPIWVESRAVGSGEAVVVHIPEGVTIAPVDGLDATLVGADDHANQTWELRGKDGSYILSFPVGQTAAGVAIPATTLFVDIGVKGPTGGEMADVVGLPEPPPPLWPWFVGAMAGGLALGGGAFWAWRRFRPVPPPPPPEPAHVVAKREWIRLRERRDLAPEVLAVELSAVYRRYLQAAEGWPATSRTSREILDNLAASMVAADLDAARRLLGAMDLVKFAERGGHAEVFERLDADFHRLCVPLRAGGDRP